MPYYLANYPLIEDGGEQFYRAPGDGRPVIAIGPPKQVPPVGVVFSRTPLSDGTPRRTPRAASDSAIELGGALDDRPANRLRAAWAALAGRPPTGNTLLDWVWSSITDRSDPTGQTAALPLLPGSRGARLRLVVGGKLLRTHRWQPDRQPENHAALDLLKRQYRRTRAAVFDGELPADWHRRTLSKWQRVYRVSDHRTFVPADLPDEPPLPHATVITDDFNRPNAATLGANWNQLNNLIEVLDNEAFYTSGDSLLADNCEYQGDITGSDMSVRMDIASWFWDSNGALNTGVLTRLQDDGFTQNTFYRFNLNEAPIGQGGQRVRLFVSNDGTQTQIGTDQPVTILGSGERLRGDTDAGNHVLRYRGTVEISETDTSIDGSTRGGIRAARNFDGNEVALDNWRLSDIGAGSMLLGLLAEGAFVGERERE